MSRAVAEAKWLRSMWTEMTCPSYTLESDRELTKQTAIVLSIDSRPAYDHLHGQVMTIKDKRLAIEMLLMKQDIGSENVLEQAHCIACHSPPIHPSLGNETRSSRHLLTNGGKVAGTQTAGKDNRGRVGCNLTQTALHKHTTTGLQTQVTKCTCPKNTPPNKKGKGGREKSPQGHLSSSHPLHDQTAHRQLEPKWHVGTASTLTGRWRDKPPTRNHAISLAMFLHTFCISKQAHCIACHSPPIHPRPQARTTGGE